ncbi:MAG: hypothetical protein GQ531_05210 [Sulfurovum sp.]|nr:hypothetical protein [Sulfurovum sp.]
MKIIKLFLLFSLVLWADFKLDVPENIYPSQLDNIVANGWSDSNASLNRLIVTTAKSVMPVMLEKMKQPVLKGIVTKEEPFPIANIVLSKDDYLFIVAYIKYLEHNKEIDEAKKLYLELYEGLSSIEDKSFLALLFRMVEEKVVTVGLIEGLEKNHYSKAMKQELSRKIHPLLDYEDYYDAIEYEKKSIMEMVKVTLLTKNKDTTVEENKLMEEVYYSFGIYVNMYFEKMMEANRVSMQENNKKALDSYSLYMEKEREEHMSLGNQIFFASSGLMVKMKSLLSISTESYGFFAEFMGKTNALVAIPLISSTSLDYVDLVEKNTKLLEKLQR